MWLPDLSLLFLVWQAEQGMAAVVPEHHDPFLGYGGLITFLIVVHVAALLFWLWQVLTSNLRTSQKVSVD